VTWGFGNRRPRQTSRDGARGLEVHPDAPQEVIELPDTLFGIRRKAETGETLVAISNITGKPQSMPIDVLDAELASSDSVHDLISRRDINGEVNLEPWQTCWLVNREQDQSLA